MKRCRYGHLLLDLRGPSQARPCMVGGVGGNHPTNRSRASTRWRISARTTCSACVFRSGIQGVAVDSGVHPPDHERPVEVRRTAQADSPLPEGGRRSGHRHHPLRADSQGPDAGIQGVPARARCRCRSSTRFVTWPAPRSNGSDWLLTTRWSRFSRCSSPPAVRRV